MNENPLNVALDIIASLEREIKTLRQELAGQRAINEQLLRDLVCKRCADPQDDGEPE